MSTGTILVVEDNPITRRMMRFALQSDGYEVFETGEGRTALELLEQQRPDLVVQDYVLADMDGLRLLEAIRATPGYSEIPILMVTGMVSHIPELRKQAPGPTTILGKPLEPSRLLEAVRSHLAAGKAGRGKGKRVLLVDDELMGRRLAALRLREAGFEVETAESGEAALVKATRFMPDAILSDVLMPGLDGFGLCAAVRQHPALSQVPVVLISSAFVEGGDRDLALKMGANALLVRTPDLKGAAEALEEAIERGVPIPEGVPAEQMARLHAERLQVQLEKQVARNEALLRQGAIQAAALSVVRGLASALATPHDVPSILADVLVHCLDASGLSTGLLYFVSPDGTLHLQASTGVTSDARDAAAHCFGHPAVVLKALESGEPTVHVFAEAADGGVREFGAGLRRSAALIVPFVIRGERVGALVLASDSQDLTEPAWRGFARALADQFGQTIALGRFLRRGAASEVRYRTLLEEANDAILLIDLSSQTVVECNRQAELLLGQGRGEILGRPYEDILDPQEREQIAAASRRLLAEKTVRVEGRGLRRPDGTRALVDVSCSLVEIGDESLVIMMLHDVTERETSKQALLLSEERFRSVVEASPNGILVSDHDGRILLVNHQVEKLFGYPRDSLLGQRVETLVPEPLRSAHATERRAFVNDPRSVRMGKGRQLHGRRQDGSMFPVEIGLSPFQSGEGTMFLASIVDVSERKALERQVAQAQKMEAIGRLAGGVAHDFNNLLGVILGNGELLLRSLGDEHPGKKRAREVHKAAERAAALTRQLLSFSRMGAGEPKAIVLNKVIEDLERMLQRLIGENVVLESNLESDLGTVWADRSQLDQVIVNLAVNARDAMPNGGRLTIETANAAVEPATGQGLPSRRLSRFVRLTVSDTGHGMDAETQARIFEPFFTTKEPGKGTGLGLASVFSAVQHAGGAIEVWSQLGVGTRFTILLPRVDGQADEAQESPEAPSVTGGETILLVEDTEALRLMLQEILTDSGYRVLAAADAPTALATSAEHGGPIHLILTDVLLPQMSGPELVTRLRRERPDARCLLMSGHGEEALAGEVKVASDRFLQKPFTTSGLLSTLREVFDKAP